MSVPPRPPVNHSERSLEVEWTTVSYRTIALYLLLALALTGLVLYVISPHYFEQKLKGGLEFISGRIGRSAGAEAPTSKREAHFVNLDGAVRVKKVSYQQWIRADYNITLEKGDFVQTAADGVARIIFSDGTNYVLKPDSLIVVEESREDPVTRATKVAVQVGTGAVDLTTGRFEVPGSMSQVAFADAMASLHEESRALVRNDPANNIHELTVDQGQADVTRGSTSVRLGQHEQVSFSANEAGLIRNTVISPPSLLEPVNMSLTMAKDPRSMTLNFSWSEVPGAVAYHLQVSPSVMLSNFVVDKKVAGRTSVQVTGLDEGTYYWMVSSIDAKGVESEASSANRLNLVQEVAGSQAYLEITKITQHGRVIELHGRTEPGSTVIVNNEQVFSIAPDGTFRHFTSPLPKSGSNQITITAQNRKGDTNTIRKTVVIE